MSCTSSTILVWGVKESRWFLKEVGQVGLVDYGSEVMGEEGRELGC